MEKKGQGMAEYGLIIALIAITVIGSLFLFGGKEGVGDNKGICIPIEGAGSSMGIGDYVYDQKGDTGLVALYKKISCYLGGPDKVGEDVMSSSYAKKVGFVFGNYSGNITGYNGTGKNIIIPGQIIFEKSTKPVNIISGSAFKDQLLESVEIPDTVENIYNNAFSGNKLTKIKLPENLETLSSGAFENNKLTSVDFSKSNNLNRIDKYAFANNDIRSITIPKSVEIIEEDAFRGNERIEITIEKELDYTKDNKFIKKFSPGKYKIINEEWVKQ